MSSSPLTRKAEAAVQSSALIETEQWRVAVPFAGCGSRLSPGASRTTCLGRAAWWCAGAHQALSHPPGTPACEASNSQASPLLLDPRDRLLLLRLSPRPITLDRARRGARGAPNWCRPVWLCAGGIPPSWRGCRTFPSRTTVAGGRGSDRGTAASILGRLRIRGSALARGC